MTQHLRDDPGPVDAAYIKRLAAECAFRSICPGGHGDAAEIERAMLHLVKRLSLPISREALDLGPIDVVAAAVSVTCPQCDGEAGDYCSSGNMLCSTRIHEAFKVLRSLRRPTPEGTATRPTDTEQSLYCDLSVSEIPGFGTNRDTHRCAKLHREKPLRTPGEGT